MGYLDDKDKEKCYGCGACEKVCPKKCVEMQEDEEGFLYPEINISNCTNCDLCRKCCPNKNLFIKKVLLKEPNIYAVLNIQDKERENSSSGGAFPLFAYEVLKQKGIIFGATFNKDFVVIHQEAQNEKEMQVFRGSKYVQSNLKDTYIKAENYLKQNRKVLYTGTPCQIAGLYSYLKQDYENLYTMDLICHGTPSPKVFKDYLQYIKKNNTIKEINFRDKSFGWENSKIRITFEQGVAYIESKEKDIFYQLFLKNYILRPSCHECKFTKINRESDITIGDYWGVNKHKPHMNDGKGTSLVIVNSKKGKEFFDLIKNNFTFEECTKNEAMQYNLQNPSIANENREVFFKFYKLDGFERATNKVLNIKQSLC